MKREFQFEEEGGTTKKDYSGSYGAKNDFGSYGGSKQASYQPREERNYQPRNEYQSYESKSYSSSRPKGAWEDVKKAQES